MGGRLKSKIALAVLAVAALLLLSSAPTAAADATFCLPGPGAGQCNGPRGLAVDTEDELVYVADNGNSRVNVFESDGTFVSSFAVGFNPIWIALDNNAASPSHHDFYLSHGFEIKKYSPTGTLLDSFGEQGKGPCQFGRANNPIAVGPEGKVYVADSYQKDPPPNNFFLNRVIIFDAAGNCLEERNPLFEGASMTIRNFAVDSAGNCYVTVEGDGGVLRKYDCDTGALLDQFGPFETEGIAIDASGNVFAKQHSQGHFFSKYTSSGDVLKRFGYVPDVAGESFTVPALAAFSSSEGEVYASEGAAGVKYLTLPPPGPVVFPEDCKVKAGTLGSVKATLQARANPEGKATTFHFEYVTDEEFLAEEFDTPQETPETPLGDDFELHEASVKVEGLTPETLYHCRVVVENADGEAIGQEGTFVTEEGFKFGPAWVTDITETEATVHVNGNPLGLAAKGTIEYVEDAKYQADKGAGGDGFDEALSTPPDEIDFGAGEAMVLQDVTLSGLKPGTTYHWRLRALNGAPPEGIVCPEQQPACPELEHTLKTYLPEPDGVDGRAYELVSPGEKNGAEVAVPGNSAGFNEPRTVRIQAGASSGEAVTYTSWTSFGEAEGAPATNQYLSRRSAGGWETENISPFGFLKSPLTPPFTGFTPDLGLGAMFMSEPSLAPGCPEEYANLYLRDNESGALACLTPEAPNTLELNNCFAYAGASADGSRAFFGSLVPYAGTPAGEGWSLYEWSAVNGLQPVSILPGQTDPVPPSERTVFGSPVTGGGSANCQTGQSTLRHVVSADGSRAIWTYAPDDASVTVTSAGPGTGIRTVTVESAGAGSFTLTFKGQTTSAIGFDASPAGVRAALEALSTIGASEVEVTGSGPYTVTFKGTLAGTDEELGANGDALVPQKLLFVRVNGTETVQLDRVQSGSGDPGNGVFWAASKDGSVVYFTDENRLVTGADTEPEEEDLYRYEFDKPLSERLTNLTLNTANLPGDVRGVVGTSEDGSLVYFVAGAVLTEDENEAGQKAQAGQDNLYLRQGSETKFVATLGPGDEVAYSEQPQSLASRVSPDGRHLAFLSFAAKELVGYDNTVADATIVGVPAVHCQWNSVEKAFDGSPLCAQVFVYDADSEALRCASCNPSGSRPLGPTLLPGWTNVYEGPRLLSEDGSRVFFETYDQLLPGDENLRRDVYEFELAGEGSCSTANPNFDPASGGCHFLVSSGKDTDESYFVDASADGRDVFFSTRAKLTGWDVNDNFDVYDYRSGGGFAEPVPPPPPCVSEASCKPPPSAQPPLSTPATPTFSGPGDKPKPNKKHKKKTKKQKQKKKQQQNKKKKNKRAHDKQRASR